VVKGEAFYRREDCEELLSRTAAGERGLRVRHGAEAVAQLFSHSHGRSFYYPVYRLSDCTPKQRRVDRPAEEVDLLLAIFTVNKTAKRYRDAASTHYQCRQHGFAGDASSKKHALYRLKDLGIMRAHQVGRLSFVAMHGNLAVYRGEGYCFHSHLLPDVTPLPEDEARAGSPVFVEAAPKGAGEARLKDAVLTLMDLPRSEAGYRRLPPPQLRQRRRTGVPHDADRDEFSFSEADDWDDASWVADDEKDDASRDADDECDGESY